MRWLEMCKHLELMKILMKLGEFFYSMNTGLKRIH